MSAEPESVHQARQQVNRLVEEIARLTESNLPPQEYFAEFLQRALTAIAAPAGTIWLRTAQGNLQSQYQVNVREIGLENIENGRESHEELLRQTIAQGRPLQIPPFSGPGVVEGKPAPANLTRFYILLTPILIEKQVAGLLEIWQEPERGPSAMRGFLQFLTDLTGFVGAFLKTTQLRQMVGQQQVWLQLESYTRAIHSSLNPREVGYAIVNEARRLLNCDRVSVAIRLGAATRVEAISGADVIEKRSALVQTMKALFDAVIVWGEKLVFAGTKDETLPPKVIDALDKYLAESNSKLLILMPLVDDREKDLKRPCRSAILVESFEPNVTPDQMTARLDVLAKHAGPALYNAVEMRRLPFRWILQPLANIQDSLRGKRGAIAGAIAGGVLLLIFAMIVIPYPLRMEAKGKLMPKDREIVYALVTGKITKVRIAHGQPVNKDDELLTMSDMERQLRMATLENQKSRSAEIIKIDKEKYEKSTLDSERTELKKEMIKEQFEWDKANAEYQILLQLSRNPQEASVRAPMSGWVVTFDPVNQLQNRMVKPGDALMQIARLDGAWEIELRIPEGHVGHIREAMARSEQGWLPVDILLMSYHDHTKKFQGRLYRESLSGAVEMENNEPVLTARVEIDDELRQILKNWQGGTIPVGAEVRAKVRCGNRAIGYVWLYELWEFFFERVMF